MSNLCGINGTATVRLVNGVVEWETWNDAIHIAKELRDDPIAMVHITEKYRVGEWCPALNAYHARLHEGDGGL